MVRWLDMKTKTKFGIIGGGALGGALCQRLMAVDISVSCWDVNAHLRTAASMDELVMNSDIILICTPSQTNRVIARNIAQGVGEARPAVISLAKGIEPGFKTMDAVLHEELGDRFVTGVISGPMLAAEISDGQTAGATVATTNSEVTRVLAQHLEQAGLIVQTSPDIAGVARTGVIKNIFALALGLADGLELGCNFKSALTVKALTDFQRLLKHFGSDPQLAYGMSGLGDLLTTGWSGKSFNWSVGQAWAQGQCDAKGEGINTLRQLAELMPTQQYPVVHALVAIFLKGADPQALTALLAESPNS